MQRKAWEKSEYAMDEQLNEIVELLQEGSADLGERKK